MTFSGHETTMIPMLRALVLATLLFAWLVPRPASGQPAFTDAEWKALRNVCK